jgi:exoribonuclease-2
MTVQKRHIVDFFDNRRLLCGVVLDCDERRVRVLTELGKETKISRNRLLTSVKDPDFPAGGSRDEQVVRLRDIAEKREEIKRDLDLRELWEVVGSETDEIELEDLSDLAFGGKGDCNCAPSLLRAIFEDKIYFKLRPSGIEVLSTDRVEQALTQKAKERERMRFTAECSEFLSLIATDPGAREDRPPPEGFIALMEEAALYGNEWTSVKAAKDIFSQAGVNSRWNPFRVLVELGQWSEDENLRLRAEKVPVRFDPEVEAAALAAVRMPLPDSATEFRGSEPIAVDAATTRDVDDALSLDYEGDTAILGIHITDVARFVEHGSPLDLAVRERATSIYMPDAIIPMIPPVLSEEAASLAAGEVRPAVSVIVKIGSDLRVKDYEIVRTLIRVKERVAYEEADERIGDPQSKEARMYEIAAALREQRIAAGAIILKDPELTVRLTEDGEIEVTSRDRETRSQILVSESMILANNLFARFLKERGIPGIFRSQLPPAEKVELGESYDPVLSYQCRKAMARGEVGLDPSPHSTLGLAHYTTATSPLRRYPDLLVQRQITSFLETGSPLLGRDELERILTEISYPMERAAILERERTRYFLLKYLKTRKDGEFEAVVLHRFHRFHLVRITELGFNAALNTPDGLALSPSDRALVRIEKIAPREDKLSLSLAKLL